MLAYLKASIRMRLAAVVHDWLAGTYLEPRDGESEDSGPCREIPERCTFFVYPRDIGWGLGGDGGGPMRGKRVRVELTVEGDGDDLEKMFDHATGTLGGSVANPLFSHGICGVQLSDEGLYFAVHTDKRFCECMIEPVDGTSEFDVRANDHLSGRI